MIKNVHLQQKVFESLNILEVLYKLCGALQKLCCLSGNAFLSSCRSNLPLVFFAGLEFTLTALFLVLLSCYSCILSGWSQSYKIVIEDISSPGTKAVGSGEMIRTVHLLLILHFSLLLMCAWSFLQPSEFLRYSGFLC